MPVRAQKMLGNAVVLTAKVKASQAATEGKGVLLNSDGTVQDVGANGLCVGVFLETQVAGKYASFVIPSALVPVKVGTGGGTVGKTAVAAADGFTDSATLGGGTTARNVIGVFWEGGVAGDDGSVILLPFVGVSA